MDISKYPIEKFFFFVAGIIPGFAALLIYRLASPASFGWFFAQEALGYKIKLSVVLLVAFIIGNSLTTFLNGVLGSIGGILGARIAKKPVELSHTVRVAPWRDIIWRAYLKERLKDKSPNDSNLLFDELFSLKCEGLKLLPEPDRQLALGKLKSEQLETQMDDNKWSQWYDHYHRKLLTDTDSWDVQRHVHRGLIFNLQTTAVYTLLSVPFVPAVWHWWSIVPSCLWALILVAETYTAANKFVDPWTTLTQQIEYFAREKDPTK